MTAQSKLLSSINLDELIPGEIIQYKDLKLGDIFSFSVYDKETKPPVTAKKSTVGKNGDIYQVIIEEPPPRNPTYSWRRKSFQRIMDGYHEYIKYECEADRKVLLWEPPSEGYFENYKTHQIVTKIKELNTRYEQRKLCRQKGAVS